MTDEELMGSYARLRAELAKAYAQPEWSAGHIDRIADKLADMERIFTAHGAHPDLSIEPSIGGDTQSG